jgi:hypothetical protein
VDEQTIGEIPDNFAFIANIANISGFEKYLLLPGYELRRATSSEISIIRETSTSIFPGPQILNQDLWERRLNSVEGEIEKDPETQWRYYVISFKDQNSIINDLQSVFDISKIELEIIFTIIFKVLGGLPVHGMIWNAPRVYNVLQNARFNREYFITLTNTDLIETEKLFSQLSSHDKTIINMPQVVQQFGLLKNLPENSPLLFLGYFSIIESLLTHPPRPNDPYESLTRQIRQKILLLDNRWEPKIDYTSFGDINPDKLWTKMYSCRSQLAHGGHPDFTGEYQILQSFNHALKLVKTTSKAIARQALIEPRLIKDLQNC